METVKKIRTRVKGFVTRQGLLNRGDRVLVAVSGGADSLCLLDVLHSLSKDMGFSIAVAHVNHGLRDTADQEQALVADIAMDYGLEFLSTRVTPGTKRGIEDGARRARYAALREMAQKANANRVATGHTATDQAETLLYRLMRGTGVAGLAGILNKGEVIRPLLCVEAAETRSYMQELGRQWVEDPSNRDTRFDRNFIRHEILPKMEDRFPGAALRLANLAADAVGVRGFIEERSENLLRNVTFHRDDQAIWLEGLPMRNMDIYWLKQVFALIGRELYGDDRPLLRRHIQALADAVLSDNPGWELDLPAGYKANAIDGFIRIGRVLDTNFQPLKIDVGEFNAGILRFRCRVMDAPSLPAGLWSAVFPKGLNLYFRPVKPGDRISPMGMEGSKKVSRALMDAKISKFYRQLWPILTDKKGQILWVPGVARSRSYPFRTGMAIVLNTVSAAPGAVFPIPFK